MSESPIELTCPLCKRKAEFPIDESATIDTIVCPCGYAGSPEGRPNGSDEPSAGAMRAAEPIWQECHTISRPRIAAMIDEHTALPELLAACEAVSTEYEWTKTAGTRTRIGSEDMRQQLRAAIAKAKGDAS